MNFINRILETKLKSSIKNYPIVAVIGPRQSGKTTLVKNLFQNFAYQNLEAPDTRLFAESDPRAFLESSYKDKGLIIDEAQKVPQLFSYLQVIVDENKNAKVILTGSQNFLIHERISQSLAGRIGILRLLPFSFSEIKYKYSCENFAKYILNGFYPPIYDRNISPGDWYQNYTQTYLERDVRQLKNIFDLTNFTNFLKLCAGRIGQLLNITSLANDCGISVNTAKSWLSVLEASFVIFLLKPYHNNFNKRITKSPKLYFIDVGLASSLLGLKNTNDILHYHSIGSIFENLIVSEIYKKYYNIGELPAIYYWRDKTGREIDLILEFKNKTKVVEIKAGKTINENYFSGIDTWRKVSKDKSSEAYLIYGGNENQKRSIAEILSWDNVNMIFE